MREGAQSISWDASPGAGALPKASVKKMMSEQVGAKQSIL